MSDCGAISARVVGPSTIVFTMKRTEVIAVIDELESYLSKANLPGKSERQLATFASCSSGLVLCALTFRPLN